MSVFETVIFLHLLFKRTSPAQHTNVFDKRYFVPNLYHIYHIVKIDKVMGDGEEQQQLDETGVKKIILQFEKRALRNQVSDFEDFP